MTKQEQRTAILRKLWWFKKDQDERLAHDPETKFAYHTESDLKKVIRQVMGINPISVESEFVWLSGKNCSTPYRNTVSKYNTADNTKVETIIRRMQEQGFIEVIQHGGLRMIKVLRVK